MEAESLVANTGRVRPECFQRVAGARWPLGPVPGNWAASRNPEQISWMPGSCRIPEPGRRELAVSWCSCDSGRPRGHPRACGDGKGGQIWKIAVARLARAPDRVGGQPPRSAGGCAGRERSHGRGSGNAAHHAGEGASLGAGGERLLQVKTRMPFYRGMVSSADTRAPAPEGVGAKALRDGTLSSSAQDAGWPAVDASGSVQGTVLVVDDEPLMLRILSRVLRAIGYRVECASSGTAGLELARNTPFDLVVSDISMPDMDGISLLRHLRAEAPDVPVILVTGDPTVATAVKALEFGAFHYLTKPVDETRLSEVVGKAACLHRMAQMRREATALLEGRLPDSARHTLESSFQRALNSLWMAYQPIVRAGSGVVYGYEALLRSGEPSLPHPGAVLDAAEKLHKLDALGRDIRKRAAADMALADPGWLLFVNLHTQDLLDPSLSSADSPLSKLAGNVVLEVTERASLDEVRDARTRVAVLREMGFRIAVDDLGAGYAGLTSFALLEPEIVKLDMSLVRDIHESSTKRKLVRSITLLAQDMGMLVVGEGVETVAERDTLVDLGCDLLQGYLFSKPSPPFPEVAR